MSPRASSSEPATKSDIQLVLDRLTEQNRKAADYAGVVEGIKKDLEALEDLPKAVRDLEEASRAKKLNIDSLERNVAEHSKEFGNVWSAIREINNALVERRGGIATAKAIGNAFWLLLAASISWTISILLHRSSG